MKNRREEKLFFPEASHDGQSPRLWGIYPQRQEGLYMQRVKVRAGRLSPAQLRMLAEISRRFTPGYPFHLTTRQDIEFHGVRQEDLRRVQKKIHAVGLVCIGACGDSLRNITVCTGSGICPASRDVAPVADSVRETLEALPFIHNLPRKFKISFSACEKACGLPYINDLGFVLRSDGTYALLGAGSLGTPSRTGIMLSQRLLGNEVTVAAVAAIRLFYRLGNRNNRHKARLRHIRERLGDEDFIDHFHEEFRAALNLPAPASPVGLADRNGFSQVTRLRFSSGDVSPEQADMLADAAEKGGAEIRIDLEHGLWVVAREEFHLPDELQPSLSLPHVISCPGAGLCSRALGDCRGVAERIRERLSAGSLAATGVKISGCPNNCSQAAVADIGLVGRVRNIGGKKSECYRLVAGGGGGKTPDLALTLAGAVPAEQAPQIVDWLIDEYQEHSLNKVPFGEFVRRERERLKEALSQLCSSKTLQEHASSRA